MRAGAGFGVELHAHDLLFLVDESFEAAVVKVDVRNRAAGFLQGFDIDGESVVLAGNLDAIGRVIQHRQICAVMPETQLIGFRSEREGQHLVTEADSKNGKPAHHAAQHLCSFGDRRGIAGPVAGEQAVGLHREDRIRVGIGRRDADPAAFFDEIAQNIVLDAAIDRDNVAIAGPDQLVPGRGGRPERLIPLADRLWRDLAHQIRAFHRLSGKRHRDELSLVENLGRDDAAQGAMHANAPRQSAGIDAGDADDAMLLEKRGQRTGRPEIAGAKRQFLHDETRKERPHRFKVFGIDAVVADERKCHRDDLAAVRRVREYFLITGHRRVEHDFAGFGAGRAERGAREDGSIFQRELADQI